MTLLEGGFGTMVQAAGLRPGEDPTDWNLTHPDRVAAIHRAYVDAGAEVALTNTFGANRLKYHGSGDLGELVRSAVANAKASGARRIALDVGPTGRLLKPSGDLDFEAAYSAFAELVKLGVAAGVDLVLVETMGDVREIKAAVLAARETCRLPIWVTVSLDESGKLLTGADVDCVVTLLESLGVDALGLNCGIGPKAALPYVRQLAESTALPVIAKLNAGLPRIAEGRTVFDLGPQEFAHEVEALVRAGASIVGGCCGTTPEHIRRVAERLAAFRPDDRKPSGRVRRTCVSSGTSVVTLEPHRGVIIGERINPTGKKLLREALKCGDVAYVLREAVKQTDAGAEILDVNCGVPGIDEAKTLDRTLAAVESVVTVPIQLDTADPTALAVALRHVNGKALVNSVNGKRESMDAVFPLVKRYGGVMVALCLDENGIPATAEGRLEIARRILAEGAKCGLAKEDFVFDALTLAVSAQADAALVTLETVRRLTEELGVNTVLGVSNVSFGLPDRPALNNAMYTLAKRAGLSAAIANPSLIRETEDEAAFDVLLGRDMHCEKWIAAHAESGAASSAPPLVGSVDLRSAVIHGLRDDAHRAAVARLAAGEEEMSVVRDGIVPALEEVGSGFERGKVFLPQLLMAADAAGAAFEAIRAKLAERPAADSARQARPVVIATVRGDVHDIGKNIVRALLENYGFRVIDLGRDVEPQSIVDTARREGAFLIGLSALMTTTVGAMAETVRLVKAAAIGARVCVGGAVVTQEYADEIGADYYAKDAMRTVRIAESLVNGQGVG